MSSLAKSITDIQVALVLVSCVVVEVEKVMSQLFQNFHLNLRVSVLCRAELS